MANSPLVWKLIADTLDQVLRLNDPEINIVEKKIAAYSALIKTAEEDPEPLDEDATEILEFFKASRAENLAIYMELTNKHLS